MPTFPLFNLLLLLLLLVHAAAASSTYNVLDYGADPDCQADSTLAFSLAWEATCASRDPHPPTLYVPRGSFSVGRLDFRGGCYSDLVRIRIDGQLVAPSDYNVLANGRSWITIDSVEGLHVSGGVLDGMGDGLWDCKASLGDDGCPKGSTTLEISRSKNVQISRLTLRNSQLGHISINDSENIRLDGLRISASETSPNTDGIHVQASSYVTVINSRVETGDDCVSIGPGTRNLLIHGMTCGPGHGISIGSLGKYLNEEGVSHVTVRNVHLNGTQNGLRIKSWGRQSTGFAEDILFEDAVMSNVHNPIVIDQNYCPHHRNCPGQDSGVRVRHVTYRDVRGTSASKVAVKFDCSSEQPCRDIRMENVRLTYGDGEEAAESYCANVGGTARGSIQPNACLRR
ncbi:hypothetical protein MLD38_016854 [Melastoma candidum]|uniref:Uncharacterized protein n=1 Tax=Melastoma candidum TaxID=119954 RepID=A0ACB9QNX5_9MYRT|nr:hypothetical protein MLD38_016854 [Melastoma candidum]